MVSGCTSEGETGFKELVFLASETIGISHAVAGFLAEGSCFEVV